MTDDQINRAIAEACGITQPDQYGVLYWTQNGWGYNCPDYCNNLDAMHELEILLSSDQKNTFYKHLLPTEWGIWWGIHATARQRAKAFLRTIGKWKEV